MIDSEFICKVSKKMFSLFELIKKSSNFANKLLVLCQIQRVLTFVIKYWMAASGKAVTLWSSLKMP